MFDLNFQDEVVVYGVIVAAFVASFLVYQYIWHIMYAVLSLIDYIFFGLNFKYGVLTLVSSIALVVLATLLYKKSKDLKRINLAPVLSVEECEQMTKLVTKKCLDDLKKHPRYKEVKKIAEQNQKEREQINQTRLRST